MSLHKGLVASAILFTDEMRNKLSEPGYPSGADTSGRGYKSIQDTIETGRVEGSGGDLSISITVGGADAPFTRAYEYGSGEHGDEGKTYEITTEKPWLFFPVGSPPQGRWPEYSGHLKPGQLFQAKKVDHPGIEAKPFVKPSLDATAPLIRQVLGKEFKAEILAGRQKVTIIVV